MGVKHFTGDFMSQRQQQQPRAGEEPCPHERYIALVSFLRRGIKHFTGDFVSHRQQQQPGAGEEPCPHERYIAPVSFLRTSPLPVIGRKRPGWTTPLCFGRGGKGPGI
ncbi:hypothetical protein NDU88_010154 [Pleurodeles waltl]|uniref:Uncharacterized protein n=1 Tax=Pleurodeles waltl TaxID=8319 RepID=A0AAV7QWN8_PLEWA|nr:hypothetical protein NDU88_010154 [Pleurodeles waltl]